MITVNDAMKNTKSGIPYKFFDIATATDITRNVVFNLSAYENKIIIKMIMTDDKIYYYI